VTNHRLYSVMQLRESRIRFSYEDKRRGNIEVDTKEWTPLHFAIASNQSKYVQYFLTVRMENLIITYADPFDLSDSIQMVKLCINQQHLQTFDLLLNFFSQYWNFTRLKDVAKLLIETEWIEGIKTLIDGVTAKIIFTSLTPKGKSEFLEVIVDESYNRFGGADQELVDTIERALVNQPYVQAAFFKVIQLDYKRFKMPNNDRLRLINQNLLDINIMEVKKEEESTFDLE